MTDPHATASQDGPHARPDARCSDPPSELPEARVVSEPASHGDLEPLHEEEEGVPRGVRVMTVVRWGLVLVMALAAGFGLNRRFGWLELGGSHAGAADTTFYCPMHPSIQQDHPGDCPICSMTLVPMPKGGDVKAPQATMAGVGAAAPGAGAAVAGSGAYYCPMHPEVTSDDPSATCDKCGGMKLEPRPGGAAPSPAAAAPSPASAPPPKDAEGVTGLVPLTLSQDRIQLMGMRTAKVVRGRLASELRTVGTVAANEKGLAVIQTRFAGWIEDLKVEQTGQRVETGQVLATVYSPELLTAQQEYLSALRWSRQPTGGSVSDLSRDLHEDARRRLELLGIGAAEIQAIERSGQPMPAIAVRSPVRGHVIQKSAVQGMAVQPGTPLFQIADLSTVWVIAEVYEHELGRVKHGQAASLELAAYPGETFTGKLTFSYPSVSTDTRTLRVRLELKNPELRLKPGMFGNVQIELERTESLLVPVEALVDTGVVQYVFVALPGGRFEPRKVKLGARTAGTVQVVHGLAEGEIVVTTANFLLDSESHLQAAILGDGASTVPAP